MNSIWGEVSEEMRIMRRMVRMMKVMMKVMMMRVVRKEGW